MYLKIPLINPATFCGGFVSPRGKEIFIMNFFLAAINFFHGKKDFSPVG